MFRPCLLLEYKLLKEPETQRRIKAVVAAYEKRTITDIYITTAYECTDRNIGATYSIGEEMVDYLLKQVNIPRQHVHFLPYGLNTAGEVAGFVYYLRDIQGHKVVDQPVWVCSSLYHLPRAVMLLRRYELDVWTIIADKASDYGFLKRWLELPFLESIRHLKDAVRPYGWQRLVPAEKRLCPVLGTRNQYK